MSENFKATMKTMEALMSQVNSRNAAEERARAITDGLADLQRRRHNPTVDIAEDITQAIGDFQAKLRDDQDISLTLTSAPSLTRVTRVSRLGPNLMVFDGLNHEGEAAQAIMHCSQVALVLGYAPKVAGEARRIGFDISSAGGK